MPKVTAPKLTSRETSQCDLDEEAVPQFYYPQVYKTSRNWTPIIAGIIAFIAGVCLLLWVEAKSSHNTLLTVHEKIIDFETTYVSSLNKSTGGFGFDSFTSESRIFKDKLDELPYQPGINIEDLPKEYLNSIASLKQVLDSVNNSARLRHLADLKSHDEDRDDLRFDFDEIAKNNGLDLSRMPDIPPLSLIQKIEDFERAEEARLLAGKEQEREIAGMRRRQAEKERQARLAATEAERERLAQRLAQRERDALIARFNFIRQVKQDILDAKKTYIFFCNANVPQMNNIRFENDRVIVKARFRKAIGDFRGTVQIATGKGVFDFATVQKMQRLIKSLDQESIDIQNWNIPALNAADQIRQQLLRDIYQTW